MPDDTGRNSNPAFQLADFLPYQIVTVAEDVYKRFAIEYEENCGLTVPEFRLLAVLSEHGVLSPTQVGQKAGMDKVKVSRASQALVSRKLIRQNIDPKDGRGRLLRLTTKGLSTYQRAARIASRLEASLFNRFSRADRAAMRELLGRISMQEDQDGESPQQGFAVR